MLNACPSAFQRRSLLFLCTFVTLFSHLVSTSVSAQYINGQMYTNGLAIIDAPAPQNPGHAGSSLPIAIDVSGDGKLPASASSNSSDSTHFESLNIFLVSAQTNINMTVSEGPTLLLNESGSTVKHLNWIIPTCLEAGNYNLTFYETSIFNNQGFFTITPVPIPISNTSPSGQCTNLNTLQAQPQSSNPLTQSPFAPNSTLPSTTAPASRAVTTIGGPTLMLSLALIFNVILRS
ncbi:hypothetical protein K438DRAFT_1804063 [Mycena galopus ATCC 62051]|nr:hypothetical protein K438DRAFT_1804063 [Mycena galopus ATCC 62051]